MEEIVEGDAARLLELQRGSFRAEECADVRVRRDRLARAIDLLVTHARALCRALAEDFGQRADTLSRFVDILPALSSLKHARREVARWMRPQRVRIGLPVGAPGVRGEIVHQPLGVVGLISPWNFPVTLTFGPLAGILAAGNRCLIKPSELTPAVSRLMQRLLSAYFEPTEVAVVLGDARVAEGFSRLAFDHLLFTGSTSVGRRVMSAASANLVPVTLELGGKCPVLLGRSASFERAVDRIMLGKLTNAGQMCIAPDYVFVPRERCAAFVEAARGWVARAYAGMPANPDYTAMISPRHVERIVELLSDATAKGASVVLLASGAEPTAGAPRAVAPALVLDATDGMRVMQEEIFGPVLIVRGYDRMEDAVACVNAGPKPLALYYFGEDRHETAWVVAHTCSGGVAINDVAVHFMADELPFGGVGDSGMGAYHGRHGFLRFSHPRAVFRQTRLDLSGLVGLRPPYGARARRALRLLIRR